MIESYRMSGFPFEISPSIPKMYKVPHIHLIIRVAPQPYVTKKWRGHVTLPTKVRDMIAFIRLAVQEHAPPDLWNEGIYLQAHWIRPRTTGYRKSHRWPWKRPDLKNYLCLLEEALKEVIYPDDSHVIHANLRKSFGSPPRIEILLMPMSAFDLITQGMRIEFLRDQFKGFGEQIEESDQSTQINLPDSM